MGLKERTYEMDMPPWKNEIVYLKDNIYNVMGVIWRETADSGGLEPVVELHRSSL